MARWLPIEQHQLKHVPLKSLPFLTSKKTLLNITKNPIILNSFSAWREAHAVIGLNISLFRKTPLCDNPNISHQITDGIMSNWASKGVKTVEDLYILDTFSNFQQLTEKFKLPKHNLFKYFQIRHWIRNNCSDFNIFNRTYYAPHRLHKMHHNSSPNCQRCRTCEGDLLHMLWKCPSLETYWKYIINIASKTTNVKIPSDPRIWKQNLLHRRDIG